MDRAERGLQEKLFQGEEASWSRPGMNMVEVSDRNGWSMQWCGNADTFEAVENGKWCIITTSTEHVRSTAEHESILAIIVLVSEPAAAHSTP